MTKKNKEVAASKTTDENLNTINNVVTNNKGFDAAKIAKEVLKNGDPIKYILDTFNTIHVGDRRIAELLTLSVGTTCIANCAGIHPKMSGESGKGKSHAGKTMIHLIPRKYVVHTNLSGKALYYHKISPGTIIFSDDVRLSEDLETLIKQATGDFQLDVKHLTVDISRTGKLLTVPARLVWWLASVDDELDEQTLNRQVGIGVDSSPETDELVLKHQRAIAVTGDSEFPETEGVIVCREIYDMIKSLFVKVVVPFAERIEWRGGGNRRNQPIFLDMIKTYALFNYMQRRTLDRKDGELPIIYASEEDFKKAAELYSDRAETQTTKLTNNELKIVDFLAAYGTADVSTIANSTGMNYQTVRHLLIGRSNGNGGMLNKVKGLSVADMTRESDGGHRRVREYTLSGYDQLSSYSSVVSLKRIKK